MSSEQAIATYIAAAFDAFSKNQEQTNKLLTDIHQDLKAVRVILAEHDTRITIHDKDIDSINESMNKSLSEVATLKKRLSLLIIASAISVVSSAASIMQTFGLKLPIFSILLKIIGG